MRYRATCVPVSTRALPGSCRERAVMDHIRKWQQVSTRALPGSCREIAVTLDQRVIHRTYQPVLCREVAERP